MIPKHFVKKVNGLKTIFVPFNTNTTSISLTFNIGYFDENNRETGITHFIEHLIATSIREGKTMKEYQKKGIYVEANASTSLFFTNYYLNSDSKYSNKILKLLLESFLDFKVPYIFLERERKSVIVEMAKKVSDPIDKSFNIEIIKHLFKNDKLVRDPKKHIDNIYNITPNDLLVFFNKHYEIKNSILLISGNFDQKSIEETIHNYKFNNVKFNIKERSLFLKNNHNFKSIFVEDKNASLVRLIYTFKTFNSNDINKYKIKMISTIFDNIGSESILFYNLRVKLGVSYSPFSNIETNQYYGTLSIIVDTNLNNVSIVNNEIFSILQSLKRMLLQDKYLKLAKARLKYDLLLFKNDMKSSNYITYGVKYINKINIEDPFKIYKDYYSKLTSKDLLKVSNKIFKSENLVIVNIFKHNVKSNYEIFKFL